MARHGSVGLASQSVLCSSYDDQKTTAFKTKLTAKSKSHTFLHAKGKTRLACWNVKSAGSLSAQSFKLHQIIKTMSDKSVDLLALSESRWQGHGITQVQSCTILHSSSDSSHSHGVAIVLSPCAQSAWEAAGSVFKPINDRIMYIRLKSHLSYITVFAIYAPTNPVSSTIEANQPSQDFYNELHSVLATIPPTDMVAVLGDLNARVGTDTSTCHTVLGPHGVGQINENGQRLLDFCATNKLIISNTWLRHKRQHQYTWHYNGDRSNPGHIIDYVLVSAKHCSSVLDTRVYRGVHHQSDHELVVSTFRYKIKTKRRQCHHPPPRQIKHLPSDTVSIILYIPRRGL